MKVKEVMRMSELEKEINQAEEEQVVEEEVVEQEETTEEEKQPTPEEIIADLQAQIETSKNDLARAYADTENMKKRLQKEADTAKKYRFQQSALEMLPIVDNMKMALQVQSDNEELVNYVKGFEMIYSQMERLLENEGVKEIEAEGKSFDHNTMQALMTEKQEGVEPGIVLQVMQTGYMLKDRILRPALVKGKRIKGGNVYV